MIPRLDAGSLENLEEKALNRLKGAVHELGFLVITNTQLSAYDVTEVIKSYHCFFTGQHPKAKSKYGPDRL